MKPNPGVLSPSTACRHFIGLCAALCTLSPALAHAQGSASPDRTQTDVQPIGAESRACADPAHAMARRRLEDEPCRLPLVRLPLAVAPTSGEPPRWPAPAAASPAKGSGHAMFWRFPVQGRGPHEVPRHSWR